MIKDKNKALNYRRAIFLENHSIALEEYLIEAHKKLPTIESRTILDESCPVLECRNFVHKTGLGVFLHIAAYTPGEHASIIKRLRGEKTGGIDTVPPPDGCEFMDGDTMALVAGDDVILCTSNLHESHAERYMTRIIEKARIGGIAEQFELKKVANVSKVRLIQNQGVKSISIDASLYSASMDYVERTTVAKSLGGGISDQLWALIKKDDETMDLEKAEHLSVKLVLSYDSRKKGCFFGREKLDSLANRMITEKDDSFSIETVAGETITANDIVLRKKISLPGFGKTIHCKDAWDALEDYYRELKDGGLLEQ